MRLPLFALFLIPMCCNTALILPQLPSLSTLSNSTSNLTLPLAQNETSPELGEVRFQCQPKRFGTGLNPESCRQAQAKMPNVPFLEDLHTYAPRGSRLISDVKLPLRYLSDDGQCAIDIGYNGPGRTASVDETSDAVLQDCVTRLLEKCEGVGSSVSKFSTFCLVSSMCRALKPSNSGVKG